MRTDVHRDESTVATLTFLRAVRGRHRAEKRRNVAFLVYSLALVGGVWGTPVLLAAARLGRSRALEDRPAPLLEALPLWAPALLALVTLVMARSATWRGPVLLDGATVAWLLPQPLARGPLLTPRLVSSAIVAALLGLLGGGVLGFLLSTGTAGAWGPATAAGAWAGLGTALLGTASGALVVRYERALARRGRRIFAAAWCAVAVLGALPVVSVVHGLPPWAHTVALWISPWGWAVQPLVEATVGGAPGGGFLAALLWACCVAGCVRLAVRAVPGISQESLRLRATVADRVSASLFSLDLRQARSATRVGAGRRARPALRIPAPRTPWLVMPWRDLSGLLRAPGRLGWAAVWCASCGAALVFAAGHGGTAGTVSAVAGTWFLYLAAAQLVEPARLESDDVRRAALLPYGARALALWHAAVPTLLLALGTGLVCAVCAAGGRWTPALLAAPTAVPACVGAALVGAYRGQLPVHLLTGTDTPMGNTAPLQIGLWYLRGMLALLVLVAPVVADAARGGEYGAGQSVWLLAVAAGGLGWARRTAHRSQG
ncbi:hypothetical protein [Streptomyces macrosporus]|uniref:hypothetical protein n=1 Tax=Streptomyces macrosporus TaxID=44032 RepID=UPI0031D584A1